MTRRPLDHSDADEDRPEASEQMAKMLANADPQVLMQRTEDNHVCLALL